MMEPETLKLIIIAMKLYRNQALVNVLAIIKQQQKIMLCHNCGEGEVIGAEPLSSAIQNMIEDIEEQ